VGNTQLTLQKIAAYVWGGYKKAAKPLSQRPKDRDLKGELTGGILDYFEDCVRSDQAARHGGVQEQNTFSSARALHVLVFLGSSALKIGRCEPI
jgi:hypothetical protein